MIYFILWLCYCHYTILFVYYLFTFSILARHRKANVILLLLSTPPLYNRVNNCLKKLKHYFTISVSFSKKLFLCKRDNTKLPKSAGPHLLRNVLTLAAKQKNHRIIKEHLTFQIKILREAIFSTSIYLFVKTLFFILRISNLILEELYTRCVKVKL